MWIYGLIFLVLLVFKGGGHTMVMVNEGPWRVSGEGDCGKWPYFASLADWGVAPSRGFARVNVVYERAGFTRGDWEVKYGGGQPSKASVCS